MSNSSCAKHKKLTGLSVALSKKVKGGWCVQMLAKQMIVSSAILKISILSYCYFPLLIARTFATPFHIRTVHFSQKIFLNIHFPPAYLWRAFYGPSYDMKPRAKCTNIIMIIMYVNNPSPMTDHPSLIRKWREKLVSYVTPKRLKPCNLLQLTVQMQGICQHEMPTRGHQRGSRCPKVHLT